MTFNSDFQFENPFHRCKPGKLYKLELEKQVYDSFKTSRVQIGAVKPKDIFILVDIMDRSWHKVMTANGVVGWIYSSPYSFFAVEE